MLNPAAVVIEAKRCKVEVLDGVRHSRAWEFESCLAQSFERPSNSLQVYQYLCIFNCMNHSGVDSSIVKPVGLRGTRDRDKIGVRSVRDKTHDQRHRLHRGLSTPYTRGLVVDEYGP